MITTLAPFALLALCAAPWLVIVGRRIGHMLGALGIVAFVPLIVLVGFQGSLLFSADPVWTTLALAGAAGVVGAVRLAIHRGVPSRPGRAAIATWLPATAGLLAWVATLVVSPLVSGSIRGWAMNGDATNNIRISRDMLENHGYPLTQLQAVPLPNELLAIAGWAGRGGSAAALMAHDLYALAAFGALAIGATGLLFGVVASSLLPRTQVGRIALVGAIASLVCATWFVSGLPIESGYFNVHVVLPFALASWLAFQQSRAHPVASGVVLVALAVVILASWSPLCVVPIGFMVVLVLRHQNSPRMPRGPVALLIVAAVTIGGLIAVATNLPTIGSFTALLASPGHGFPSTLPILAAMSLATIVAAVAARRRGLPNALNAVVAVCASIAVGMALLLALNITSEQPWLAYYPAKYSWMATVVLAAILLALVVLHVSTLPRRWATAAIAASAVLAVAAATLGPAPHREDFEIEQPLARILTDSVWTTGERSVETIVDFNGQPGIVMQWATGSPDEAFINFWALEFKGAGPNLGNDGARYLTQSGYRELRDTGAYLTPQVSELCNVVSLLGGSAVVHTRDVGLTDDVHQECPDVDIHVVIDGPAPQPRP